MLSHIIKLLYPKRCMSCLNLLPYNEPADLCQSCMENLRQIEGDVCKKCGKQLSIQNKDVCYDCQRFDHRFERGWAVYTYQGVIQNILHNFKYKNHPKYGKFLAKVMYEYLYGSDETLHDIHMIIPIPVHKNKMGERGYNQAEVLGKEFSRLTGIAFAADVLIRSRDTQAQSQFSGAERRGNLKGAFSVKDSEKTQNKNILLVDDIFTTGSTIDECAGLLKENGAAKVYFYSVAIAADADYQ